MRPDVTRPQYDDEKFLDGYLALRSDPRCFNDLLEMPTMLSMLPDVRSRDVLDLGCGFGVLTPHLLSAGARSVTGIDASERMLEIARSRNPGYRVRYVRMDMDDLSTLGGVYDVAVSSLALHYVRDLEGTLTHVRSHMRDFGELLFSVEHPISTANPALGEWETDRERFIVTRYADEGIRGSEWLGSYVESYHRTFSTIVNSVVRAGFSVEEVREPVPSPDAVGLNPALRGELNRPSFLFVRARVR